MSPQERRYFISEESLTSIDFSLRNLSPSCPNGSEMLFIPFKWPRVSSSKFGSRSQQAANPLTGHDFVIVHLSIVSDFKPIKPTTVLMTKSSSIRFRFEQFFKTREFDISQNCRIESCVKSILLTATLLSCVVRKVYISYQTGP